MIEAKFTVKPRHFALDFSDNAEEVSIGHYFQGIFKGGQQLQRFLQVVRDPIWGLW
jgi:hypothetical protein